MMGWDDQDDALHDEREEARTERDRSIDAQEFTREERRYGIGAPTRAEAERDDPPEGARR